ncbi:MAG: O-methyltransferase [Phycisphaerales bacterium]
MKDARWAEVDRYIAETLVGRDAALDAAAHDTDAAGLPPISVTPSHGKLLMLLATMCGARRILEIGTLGGYSAIWMAKALPPDGQLVTLEIDPRRAEVARANIARAGFGRVVDVRVGRAIDVLPTIAAARGAPFDLVFIDADKPSNPEYFAWALELTRRGGVIVVDNVVRDGAIVDAKSTDASVLGVRRLNELIAAEPRVRATTIQTVGAKGYDGFTLAVVTGA